MRRRRASWHVDNSSFGPTFTIPVPTSLTGWVSGAAPNLTLTQTGSRIHYIDPNSVNDPATTAACQALLMFWNGANIVDASGFTSPGGVGTLYGTDPLNPSGPVNTFRTWTSVAPRANGAEIGGTYTGMGMQNQAPTLFTRSGFADWFLFKRGTTIDLENDRAAWGSTRVIAAVLGGLNLPRGKSVTERMVMGSYGPTATARPTFTRPTVTFGTFFGSNIAGANFQLYTGLKLDGNDRSLGLKTQAGQYIAAAQADRDVNFEDCWWHRCCQNFSWGSGGIVEYPPNSNVAGKVIFTGCLLTDFYNNISGTNCIFNGGNEFSAIALKSTIMMRGGMQRDPSLRTSFNPDGVEVITGEIITAISGNGSAVTVTTGTTEATAHGCGVGDPITVSGATGGSGTFNGTFTVASVPSSNILTYSATGNGAPTGTTYTTKWVCPSQATRNRNFYSSGKHAQNDCEIYDNVSITGASGWQMRAGGLIEGNFFYEGYVNVGAAGANSGAVTGSFKNNVLQRFVGNSGNGNPGYGFLIGGGSTLMDVSYNIYSQAQTSVQDPSGGGWGLQIPCFSDDIAVPWVQKTANNNFHHNILDVVFTNSPNTWGIREEEGDVSSQSFSGPDAQVGFPITGWGGGVGSTLTCTITVTTPAYIGTPAYEWRKNSIAITGPAETASTYVLRTGDLTVNTAIRCYVTGISFAGTTGLGLTGNTISNNVITNPNVGVNLNSYHMPTGVTPPSASDTVYTANTLYATIAAAKAGQGWLDETRTLKTYLVSLGKVVTTADGAQEYYNLVTAMQRGNIDTDVWSGKKINNHVRAGRHSASLPLPPLS